MVTCGDEGHDDGPVSPLAPRPALGDRVPPAGPAAPFGATLPFNTRLRTSGPARRLDRHIATALRGLNQNWPSVGRHGARTSDGALQPQWGEPAALVRTGRPVPVSRGRGRRWDGRGRSLCRRPLLLDDDDR